MNCRRNLQKKMPKELLKKFPKDYCQKTSKSISGSNSKKQTTKFPKEQLKKFPKEFKQNKYTASFQRIYRIGLPSKSLSQSNFYRKFRKNSWRNMWKITKWIIEEINEIVERNVEAICAGITQQNNVLSQLSAANLLCYRTDSKLLNPNLS